MANDQQNKNLQNGNVQTTDLRVGTRQEALPETGNEQGNQQGSQQGEQGRSQQQAQERGAGDVDGLEGKKPEELTPEELRLMADTMPGEGPGD